MIDNRIVTFLTLTEIGNYTRTAEKLHMTQPAVSQHIKYLEEYYGAELFYKRGRELILTPEGRELKVWGIKMQTLARSAEESLRKGQGRYKRYRVGTTLTVGDYIMPGILRKYREKAPQVDISVEVRNTREILKSLEDEGVDLALVEGMFNKNKYNYKLLKRDELILAVSREHHLSSLSGISLEKLTEERIIVREEGSGTRRRFEAEIYLKGMKIEDFTYSEGGSLTLIKSLIEEGIGAGIISRSAVEAELARGSIVEVEIEGINLEREINFVWTKRSYNTSFIDEFIDSAL